MVEVAHYLFELAFAHLPVTYADTRFRDQFGEISGALLDRFHIVVQVIDLAAAQQLAQ